MTSSFGLPTPSMRQLSRNFTPEFLPMETFTGLTTRDFIVSTVKSIRMRKNYLRTTVVLRTSSHVLHEKKTITSLHCPSIKNRWKKLWQQILILYNLHSVLMRFKVGLKMA